MIRFALSIFLVWILSYDALSQQNDFVTWNYINLTHKVNENWSTSFTEHMLRNENATETWLFLHDLSVNHRISRHVSHELHVRLINQKQLDDQFADREMLFYAINGKAQWRSWTFSARTRWQGLVYGRQLKDAYKGPYYYHRFRLGVGKAINYHWKAGLNAEIFQPLNRPKRAPFDQIRWGASMSYRLNRYLSLEHFFQIQKQLSRTNPYTYFVWGIGCNFTW